MNLKKTSSDMGVASMIIYDYADMDPIFMGGVSDPLISLQTELFKYGNPLQGSG